MVGTVLLMGVNNEHEGALQDEAGSIQSVSVRLKFSGIRKDQNRNVSTSRQCLVKWNVAPKSATFETRLASPSPVLIDCRIEERVMSPLKNSSRGAFMSAE